MSGPLLPQVVDSQVRDEQAWMHGHDVLKARLLALRHGERIRALAARAAQRLAARLAPAQLGGRP